MLSDPAGELGQVRVSVNRHLKQEPHLPDPSDEVLRNQDS